MQLSYLPGSIARMSTSIRDRLMALALYRMVSAISEADEVHPQSHSHANPISLLERLYRLSKTKEAALQAALAGV
jgi:hypothetical protein